ncbi:hypothetical protein [Streptomyces noursei]
MSPRITLTCDTDRCASFSTSYATCILSFAREMAGYDGWVTTAAPKTGEIRDLCPQCAPHKAPPRKRRTGKPCPPSAPCHLLGHDSIGHRLTNALARRGMTLEEAAALANDELFKVAGIGPQAIARLRRLKNRSTAPNPNQKRNPTP